MILIETGLHFRRDGIGGRTCSCPTSPQTRHVTRIGRHSDPLP